MPRDKGGRRSKGRRIACPKCKQDDATLIESVIYGKKTKTLFCSVCSHDWPDDDEDRDT